MKHLHLGEGLDLPLETSVVQRYAFVGKSGSGKTYAAGKLVELWLDAGVQVVIFDSAGTWYGLRAAASGGDGIPIPVFGGQHGDIPLQSGAGTLVADLVVDRGISVVLDASEFNGGELRRFATLFAEQLFQRKKSHRGPMQLVLEEAHTLAPQNARSVGERGGAFGPERMLGAFEKISKIGRNYGIGLTAVTQRPQSISKEVLNQTELLLVGQTNGFQEREALRKWMTDAGGTIKLVDELPHLPVGTMYAWSPSWLQMFAKVKIAKKRTADVSETPKFGATVVEPAKLAPVDLQKIGEAMASAVEEQKANDPALLKKRIAELEKAAGTGVRVEVREVVKEVERVVTLDRDLHELRAMLNGAHDLAAKLHAALEPVARDKAGYLTAGHPDRPRGPGIVHRDLKPENMIRPIQPAQLAPSKPAAIHGANQLGKAERALLNVLAQRDGHATSAIQLAILSCYSHTSSSFHNALGKLRSGELATGRGEDIRITSAGLDVAGHVESMPRGRDLVDYWKSKLGKAECALLDTLVERRGYALTKQDLADRSGYSATSSSFNNALGKLRTLGLATRGNIPRASDHLFDGHT